MGEIQAATEGDLSSWAWISGEDNTADCLTRGRLPDKLAEDSHWWNGLPIEKWGLKFGRRTKCCQARKFVTVQWPHEVHLL